MRPALELVTPPSGYVVQPSELWDHLRLDLTDVGSPSEPADADYVLALNQAAESYLDGQDGILGRALLTQTWRMRLDYFPASIKIPLPPLVSVDSITYVDTDGATQTLASSVYQVVDNGKWPSEIVEAYNQDWPTIRDVRHAVTVTFTAGYGDADSVPAPIKHAIKIMVAEWYGKREETVLGKSVEQLPRAVMSLINPLRVQSFG